ncbi:hydroxysqualene dehydroxylase HpnE [Streptosporangium sp. NBC_01755]|uniref:hydroxysqualene dehydroxylase HpnE n=1 Tax=unclassified Streptosporangium TaxID=2632669 RepID=UPI002DDABE1F|nr:MULTISPECIES: hydroxysqualene dehydroxylase HpnE [unclassified Streptosporangium]WSA24654.1 hydroxysqualene dehydroxylase HpnE [Streptosporangium sp. NBC_01810]WSC97270.1 hydroxysqualene dehydroxylase HpnE [Streptosporangium sp. NBC_01755]
MSPAPVAIVGGGLAGIAAAVALGEAGHRVTLYEARPRLGGATCSFVRNGLSVDNGQHVFLRCCTAYRGLLDRLGVAGRVHLQDRFDVRVLTPAGRCGRLRRGVLPGPFHLLPALAGYQLLKPADRLRAMRVSLALRRLDPADPALDLTDLGSWLTAHGQRERARHALWELFAMAALNVGVEGAALGPAAMVFKTALLGRAGAADIGVPAVPLGELHGTAARAAIERRGGAVRLSAKVTAIEPDSVIVDGSRVEASAVIVATAHEQAAALVPEEAAPGRERWRGLNASPIVNVHVVYDRRVTRVPFAAVVDSPVQWVFDKTRAAGLCEGQYLAVSVSAADRWIDTSTARVRATFVPALEQIFPGARQARIIDFFVTRERRATFRQCPGSGALRPEAATRWPGLFLAGAWTDTGWPDTMEAAVRSGLNATCLVRRHLKRDFAR